MNDQSPHRLYKYTTAGAAVEILSNMSLKWSSVLEFNDPFEHAFEIASLERDLEGTVYRMMCDMIRSPTEPVLESEDYVLGPAVLELRRNYQRVKHLGFDIEAELESKFGSTPFTFPSALDTINELKELLQVFSMSRRHKDLLMWAHYSDHHRGVVFELAPQADERLATAAPVLYSVNRIPYASAEDVARQVLGLISQDDIELSNKKTAVRLILTKSDHWEYEKEWRCFVSASEAASAGGSDRVSFLDVNPGVFTRIILGCRISDEDRGGISTLAREKLGDIPIVQAQLHPGRFELVIEEP